MKNSIFLSIIFSSFLFCSIPQKSKAINYTASACILGGIGLVFNGFDRLSQLTKLNQMISNSKGSKTLYDVLLHEKYREIAISATTTLTGLLLIKLGYNKTNNKI